jgi:hypothetical protein
MQCRTGRLITSYWSIYRFEQIPNHVKETWKISINEFGKFGHFWNIFLYYQ